MVAISSKTILIIEDEKDVVDLLALGLGGPVSSSSRARQTAPRAHRRPGD
ncbi:MAG: hypothetical protein ABR514_05125 [Chthoniobacterales bacterium]